MSHRLAGEHRLGRAAGERCAAQQSVVRGQRQGVQVNAVVHRLAQQLLRCGELRSPRLGHRAGDALGTGNREHQPEVGDQQRAGGVVEQQVLGLDVAMHQAAPVCVAQSVQRLVHEAQHPG